MTMPLEQRDCPHERCPGCGGCEALGTFCQWCTCYPDEPGGAYLAQIQAEDAEAQRCARRRKE